MPKKEPTAITAAKIGGKYNLLGVVTTGIVSLLVAALVFVATPIGHDIVFPPTITSTVTPLIEKATSSPVITLAPSNDIPAITSSPVVEDQLITLAASFLDCINSAKPESEYDMNVCWGLLSDQYRTQFSKDNDGYGRETFFNDWKNTRLGYALYYCRKLDGHYVDTVYYRYVINDLSTPEGTEPLYMEFTFGLDNNWYIKSIDTSITKLSPDCEVKPRREKWTPLR